MKVAALPLNTTQGTSAALGRQFVNFVCETVRIATGAEINSVSYLTQIPDEGGTRSAFVNVADTLAETAWIRQLFEQSEVDWVSDGLLSQTEDGKFSLTWRFTARAEDSEPTVKVVDFESDKLFDVLHGLIVDMAAAAQVELPEEYGRDNMDFGTEDPAVFLKFLEGYDAVIYVQQVQGQVAKEFSPEPAINFLLEACRADPDFLGPYESLVQLCRFCVNYRIGTFEIVEKGLTELTSIVSDDYRAYYALAEACQATGDLNRAADLLEKSISIEQTEPALYTRLGIVQMMLGMPANAERNLRKAVEMEGDEKPSMDFLANVLQQTNRNHEIPALWRDMVEKNPQNAQAHAKLAISYYQCAREDDGKAAFEKALETLEDNTIVKRYYAPVLAQTGELDRAMDFFEDCLDLAPNDIQLLLEYARTLKEAARDFEVPKVLRDVLSSNPDPNTRAQTQAWLLELEQTKRTNIVEEAREKMDKGDFDGAVKDLKPLRNWLADYWKMWALMASAYNRLNQSEEAEDAARRLVDLFPGCEPGYGELIAALGAQGKHEEAYGIMRVAAVGMPQSLPVHLNLALAAKRAGKVDEARSLAKQIREAVGPNEEIEQVLSEIER
jgi:Flp pilus assembly protein TadD